MMLLRLGGKGVLPAQAYFFIGLFPIDKRGKEIL
jgi:hypothetical protein